jgi:LysM repeat protein
MCGFVLDGVIVEEEEPVEEEEEEPRRRSRWWFWPAVAGLSLLILVVIGLVMRPFLFPALPTPTASAVPTRTSVPTLTALPTDVPTATPTPTPLPPRAHQVEEGETLISIAEEYETTVEEILTLNPGITPELLQVGQVLLIPPAVPEPEPTGEVPTGDSSPTPTDFIVHVVEAGDTLSTIAEEYGVTVALIRAANSQIAPGSDVIRVNQTLIIPIGTPMPSPTPTADLDASPTPIPLYSAPSLLGPLDGTVFGGPDAVIVLQWASVSLLGVGEWYELRLLPPDGDPLLEYTRSTAYRLSADLYPSGGSREREFSWQVHVVRRVRRENTYELASDEGAVYTFTWLEDPLTPTPTVVPSPTP